MTTRPKSDFLEVMVARGYLQDCTDLAGLDERLMAGVVPAYVGYDATAQSLHVGHLLNIMMLRWLQKTGHKPITLMGGGTSKVGDPSFRDDERPLLTPEQIAANIATIRSVFAKYLDYSDSSTGALMLDNAEWLDGLNYLGFLRDIGRHFSVNRMLSFESVKSRLDRDQSLTLPRVQLHDPAGLRLPRAPPPRTAASCRWAARTSGATSSTASTSPAASPAPRSSA